MPNNDKIVIRGARVNNLKNKCSYTVGVLLVLVVTFPPHVMSNDKNHLPDEAVIAFAQLIVQLIAYSLSLFTQKGDSFENEFQEISFLL